MDFSFGAARKLYRQGVHPRLLLGPSDVETLRRRVRSGDGKKIMMALRRKVRPLVRAVLDRDSDALAAMIAGANKSWHTPGILVLMAMDDMAMVGAIDEDADAIEAVRRVCMIMRLGDFREWGYMGHCPLAFDLLCSHLSESDRRSLARALLADMRARLRRSGVRYYKSAGGNIPLLIGLTGLLELLVITGEPGVPSLERELPQFISRLQATLHVVTGPDGYPTEDVGYGTGVSAWLAVLCEALRRAGIYDPYSACPRYSRFGRAILHFVQPWGEDLSNTGDHGDDFQNREFVLARLAAETKDPTLLWLLGTLHYTHGKVHPQNTLPDYYVEVPLRKGFRTQACAASLIVLDEFKGEVHPGKAGVPTQFRDRGRGIVSFRSGWGGDDTLVVFDGSQRSSACAGHHHDSSTHFSISALGEYFAVDSGRYGLEQNQHNVVLVDGKSGRSTEGEWTCNYHSGILTDYVPDDFCDVAAADGTAHSDCLWAKRWIGLVKGKGTPGYVWTVEDVNKDNAMHEFWWALNTCPENVIAIRGSKAVIRGWRCGNYLDVHFALLTEREYPQPHRLRLAQDVNMTSSYKYVPNARASAQEYARPSDMVHGPVYVRPRLIAKVTGWNGRFMSVMIPRRKGERPAKVTRLRSVPSSFAVQVTFPKVEDVIIFAYEHNLLEAGDVKGRGKWCAVRRSRANGRILAWTLGHGSSLQVNGRALDVRGGQ